MAINLRKLTPEEYRKLKVKTLAALEMNQGNMHKTAKEMGVSRGALRGWAAEHGPKIKKLRAERAAIAPATVARQAVQRYTEVTAEEVAQEVEQVLRLSESRLDHLAGILVESLINDVEGKGEKVNFYQRSGTLNIVFPVLQLLKGKPTGINENVTKLTRDERKERTSELLEIGKKRMELVPKPTGTNGSNGNHG